MISETGSHTMLPTDMTINRSLYIIITIFVLRLIWTKDALSGQMIVDVLSKIVLLMSVLKMRFPLGSLNSRYLSTVVCIVQYIIFVLWIFNP